MKKQHKAKKRNAVVVASLTIAFMTEALMKHVNKACYDNWPRGLAHKIIESLFAKYCPKDNITKVELCMILNKVLMKNDDSNKLFEQLGEIQNYNTNENVGKANLMAVVFMVTPARYQSVLFSLQLEKKDKLTLEDLKEAMDQVWQQNSAIKNNSTSESSKDELNLTNQDNGKTKKNCHFKSNCSWCGKEGHMACNFWKDPKNSNKQPNAYKIPAIAAAITDKSSKELQLSNVVWGTFNKKTTVICKEICTSKYRGHKYIGHKACNCGTSKTKGSKKLQLVNLTWGVYKKAFAKDDYKSEDDFNVYCK